MGKSREYLVYCRFSAIGTKKIKAFSLNEAKRIAKSDKCTRFDESIRLTEPCTVDEVLLRKSDEPIIHQENVEYKSWDAE